MNTRFFVDRPIMACSLTVLLTLFGVISIFTLPMEQYPDIAPPTVVVSASYTGASAETVQKSVIVPLEESINGVENMSYMTSTASNSGSGSITVFFRQGTDPDMAAVNVQNRVSKVQATLPAEVTSNGVTTEKRQSSQLKILTLYSPDDSFDQNFLNNYAKINLVPQIQRIQGVGGVVVLGQNYSMRIWLNPQKMLQFGLVPKDIANVLGEQNLESPTGTLGEGSENTFLYPLKYRGRYETPAEFENLVIKSLSGGKVLRLKDVATIELGALSYNYDSKVNGHPGCVVMIMQTAGSNANQIIIDIDKLLDDLRADLPKGMAIADLLSAKDFLDASIHEVVQTLFEALGLVVLVVLLFLQSFRSTIIPSIAVVVSLVCTFAFIKVAGFSINLLTLFALILVIGTVVDDAIVVVEAVQVRFEHGTTSPYKATNEAMGGISMAILTTSLVFMSVFVPVCFIGGTSGTFYTQFGVTMAVAVGISAFNALTMCPALCALFMKPAEPLPEDGRPRGLVMRYRMAFDTTFRVMGARYISVLKVLNRFKIIVLIMLVGGSALLMYVAERTKTGLIPDEDTGVVFVSATTPPGYTLAKTKEVVAEVTRRIEQIEELELTASVAGYSLIGGGDSYSGGTLIARLKNWEERPNIEQHKDAVIYKIFALTADIREAQIFAFSPPMITGYGTTNGVELYMQDRHGGSIEDFNNVVLSFLAKLNQRPEVEYAMTTFNSRFPQYQVTVDAPKCKRLGVSPSDVLSALSIYVGGSYQSDINLFSKMYHVMVQADPVYRLDPLAFNNMFVRNSEGRMLPIGQFVTLKKVYGPETLTRFNMFSSIAVNAAAAPGYSSGSVINAIAEVARETLPQGYGYEYGGMTRDEASQGGQTIFVYALCVVFVYILLCCLYESLLIPLSVLLSIPFGMLGAFLLAYYRGLENNIYMQTGLIMLMGLIAKTAILLTQYAVERRRQGLGIVEAAFEAARDRLRPILMTAICMIAGMMPLVVAHGVGANGNQSLGTGVVGGMVLGTICLLLVTPVFFILFQSLSEKFSYKDPDRPKLIQEPQADAAGETPAVPDEK